MSDRATELRELLIRNFEDQPKERELRPPLYDTLCARLGRGTAAHALGMSIDIVAPGMRGWTDDFSNVWSALHRAGP